MPTDGKVACDFCGREYISRIAASMCCDPLNDLDDEWRGCD